MGRIHFIFFLVLFYCGLIAATKPGFLVRIGDGEAKIKLGKNIYSKGIGSGESILANMSGVNVPATVMPCINCHNSNGRGNPEGGVIPSNITWNELTKSYGGLRKNGSKHPPYTVQSLKKAITMGIDPGGNELNSAMPRFNMSLSDLDCLISYLKTLGDKEEVGLHNANIRIGVALSGKKGADSVLSETVKKILNAYCNRVNNKGGIYGRKLETDFFYLKDVIADKSETLQNLLNEKNYLAITGFGLQNQTDDIAKYANTAETPTLMPFSQNATPNGLDNSYAFYMYPSLSAQGKSLADFSKKIEITGGIRKTIIIYQNDLAQKTIANQIAIYYASISENSPSLVCVNNNIEATVVDTNISNKALVFYIGSSITVNKLLQGFDKVGKHPYLLAIGSLSDINLFQLPEAFKSKVYIAYPTWATDRTITGLSIYQSLKKEYNLGNQYRNTQLDAMAVIMTLEECFKRVGKELTKEKMLKALEELYEYRTGLTPPFTYNTNQRVGSNNIYITTFNKEKGNIMLVNTLNSREL